MTAPPTPGRAWTPGSGPAPGPPEGRGRRLLWPVVALVSGAALVVAGVVIGRREPPAPSIVVTVDRSASAVMFGGAAPRVTAALSATVSGPPGGPAGSVPLLGLEGAGHSGADLLPDGRVAVDIACGAVETESHRAVVGPAGAGTGRTVVLLATGGGSWRGLVEAVCWQQALRTGVSADVDVVDVRPGSRRLAVDVVVRNGTADRLGLVLVVPPVRRAALVRPDGRLDGAEDDRTTWIDAGGAVRLSRTLLVPCGDERQAGAEFGLRFRRDVPAGERWDAPEPPLRGPGFVTVPLGPEAVVEVRRAVSRATAGAEPARFCR